ncbi:hypothetical protein [Hyalangium sp.]|uniref:hypothetical protein n=1 Tax=Hyalangium sp. TaxID=2028555 RepID=UPI002D55F4F8|nr:hypothetical protein [Hyalangium sp.]HYH95127.1 hypothetical protein [Hyalangium sp.]
MELLAGSSRRRTPLLAAGLGAALLLAGVGLFARGSGEEASSAVQAAQATAQVGSEHGPSHPGGSAAPPGQAGAGAPSEERGPRFDGTTCWRELERFNAEVTIENFHEWATPLLESRDSNVRDYLKERLTELIGKDAGRAHEVLGWAREAKPRTFGVYMMALRDSEAVHLPQISAQLVDMGLDTSLSPDRRAGLLSALDTQKRLEPATLDRLASFAKDPVSGEAGWAATRSLARVMKRDFQQTGNLAPYMDKLLTIGAESPDEQIRYLGQMMPMHAAPLLDAEATERFAKILATEGNEDGRDAAAHNLSLSQDKQKVLELFARTFETDTAVCVRWAVFRFSARVAGKDALPVMANMAIQDPRFQPDYQAFEQLYASGVLDFVRVWNSLPNPDPHHCLDRHD